MCHLSHEMFRDTCDGNQGEAKESKKEEFIHIADVDEEAGSEAPETRCDLTNCFPAETLSVVCSRTHVS